MLAIGAALRWEIKPIVRALEEVRNVPGYATRIWLASRSDRTILIFQTGVGWERAAAATRAVLAEFPISVMINAGCAGALAPGLQPGALIVPDTVIEAHPQAITYETDSVWARRLREAAARAGRYAHADPIVSSAAPLTTAAAKREAFRQYGGIAVEMEAAAVARITAEHGKPFAAARVILDAADTDVPLDGLIGPSGIPRPLRLATNAVRNPGKLRELAGLAGAVHEADSTLNTLFAWLFRKSGNRA